MCIVCPVLTWSVNYVMKSKLFDKHVPFSNKGHLKPQKIFILPLGRTPTKKAADINFKNPAVV